MPEPGSTEVGAVAVAAGAVALGAVEGVVATHLVAHLVGDVVDRVDVADRLREAGAAARTWSRRPPTPSPATPPPLRPRPMWPMSKLSAPTSWPSTNVLRSRVPPAQPGRAGRRVKQALAPQGPFGPGRLGGGDQVELGLGAGDEQELVGEVVVVDLVDPVDQRGLRGETSGSDVAWVPAPGATSGVGGSVTKARRKVREVTRPPGVENASSVGGATACAACWTCFSTKGSAAARRRRRPGS